MKTNHQEKKIMNGVNVSQLFQTIEAIQGKPVSIRVREAAQQVGIILLVMLMVFVFYNDTQNPSIVSINATPNPVNYSQTINLDHHGMLG